MLLYKKKVELNEFLVGEGEKVAGRGESFKPQNDCDWRKLLRFVIRWGKLLEKVSSLELLAVERRGLDLGRTCL